jgi:ElaB/YqjD/DUF883 family membrane-anchored ribosome-binding protein
MKSNESDPTTMEIRTEDPHPAADRPARERVLADLRSLGRDAEDLIKATASAFSSTATDARTRIDRTLHGLKRTCNQLQDQTASKARVVAEKSATAVRGHPHGAVGVAFGVGLMMGLLVARLFSPNEHLSLRTH